MSRELKILPAEGSTPLDNDELVRRLRGEFAWVEESHEEGVRSLELAIAHWQRVSPRVFELAGAPKGSGPALLAQRIERLRAELPHARYVTFGDDAAHAHGQLLDPGEGLLIVAENGWQEQLAERCARALGYEVYEI